ncbi:hypothetical protein NBRC116583_04140 [Arenicella sp. 4NH20-0111]|uniref:nicotinate (nicotinamide) nucleotide adenylyltransferase n=1 Tax=Arenicella sp. 4NH20-0111 TaxID=3127648 RepID=UPI00310AADAE
MLIGLFGGTFDPIHFGHTKSIDLLHSLVPFDQIYWVLSARPPHKDAVSASIKDRFEMLKLALGNRLDYFADDTEITRTSKSYTIDTVETFKKRYPSAHFCVVIGGDSLQTLHKWHRYEELITSVNWLVMHRPGYPLEVPRELRQRLVESPTQLQHHNSGKIWVCSESQFNVSSTRLRAALAKPNGWQDSIVRDFLAPEVVSYIRSNNLYQTSPSLKEKHLEPNKSNSNPYKSDSEQYKLSKSSHFDNIMNSEQLKDQVVDALEDVKGQDIKVIDIADISDFADFMVVASGTSDTHVKALARSASDKLRVQGVKPLNEDGADVGEWVLVDFGDVVLHVMRPEVRAYYDLEKLWDEDVRKLVEKHREEQSE